jgi:hypothetical protein
MSTPSTCVAGRLHCLRLQELHNLQLPLRQIAHHMVQKHQYHSQSLVWCRETPRRSKENVESSFPTVKSPTTWYRNTDIILNPSFVCRETPRRSKENVEFRTNYLTTPHHRQSTALATIDCSESWVWVGKAGLVLGLGCGWGKAGFSGLVVGLMGLRTEERERK